MFNDSYQHIYQPWVFKDLIMLFSRIFKDLKMKAKDGFLMEIINMDGL